MLTVKQKIVRYQTQNENEIATKKGKKEKKWIYNNNI